MAALNPKHIFIVEDNEIYALMLDYILSKESIYQFVSFNSGEECVKNLYLNPDVIILDHGLPGMNGYQTLLEIKKHNKNIHVVILSSNKDAALAARMIAAGADDYILKQGHGESQIIDKIEVILSNEIQRSHLKIPGKKLLKKISKLIPLVFKSAMSFFTTRKKEVIK